MKHFSLFLIIVCSLLSAPAVMAQRNGAQGADREQWFKEMREYKHAFLAKELNLSKDQQRRFFAIYDDMMSQTGKLASETRALTEKVQNAGDKATDADYDRAIEAMANQKVKEGEIERDYINKFKTVLTKKQLFQLKTAERKFARDIMKHHRRLRNEKK